MADDARAFYIFVLMFMTILFLKYSNGSIMPILFIVTVISTLMRKTIMVEQLFKFQGFVYVDSDGFPVQCSERILWLDKFEIIELYRDEASQQAIQYYKGEYPQYNKYIKLMGF